MKIHRDIQQGSLEWSLLRAGKVTASEMDSLVSATGEIRKGDGVKTYLAQKLVERWTGGPLISLQGIFDVDQGSLLEEKAKPAFTVYTGIEIEDVAFVESDNPQIGCSPDGLIGDTSGCEIKCPKMETHMRYLLDGKLPKEYAAQVQGCMWVTGRPTWHFFSYNRSLPPLHLVVERDDKFHDALENALASFLEALEAGWKLLCEKNGGEPKRFVPTPVKPADNYMDLIP